MSAHNVHEDESAVSRADRVFYRLESLLTLVAGIVALGVMLLAVANIIGRKLFDLPVPGYVDWTVLAVPAIAILGLSACQRDGGHIRMDILVGRFKGRMLWFVELLGVLLMLVITIGLIYGSWDHTARALRNGDSTIDINLPVWPAKILFPIMFGLLAIRLCLQIWGYWVAFRSGAKEPAAVPIPIDAAQQALAEAETVSGFDDDEETEVRR